MIYLYAYTNHKENLDSLRRVKVIYEALKKEGIESEILINEYRAQLLARDWGLPLATTIETIKDIDAVAGVGDIILIDSPERLEGKVLNYPANFKAVIYINSSCESIEFKDAEIVDIYNIDSCIFTECKTRDKNGKTLLIYSDSDYDKFLIKNLDNFRDKNLYLYWGIYFFVKYEDELKEVFEDIIESEEYYSAICEYKNIITTSLQIALEAKANGANSYLLTESLTPFEKEFLDNFEIGQVEISNINISNKKEELKVKTNNNYEKIVNILKDYM